MPVASELLVRISADTDQAERGIDRVDKKVASFAKGASVLGTAATAAFLGVGAAAVGLGVGFGKAVGAASDFQAVISQVGAVSGATAPELAGLSDLALKMGADTAFSASQAAQAMAELAKGGIEVADMAAVLPGVLDLAAAGGLGLAEAATIATDTLAIFAAQGVSMDRVANAFAGAANISSISVQDMAESMKYVGPISASLGLSLEDTAAAIALLGANGLKGSQAGTGLRTMLTSLAAPTARAQTLMADLGINVFDASGKMKDFAGISDTLKTALKGMSDQQRLATLETLFGKEGLSAAIAMMGEGENSIQSYTDKLRKAASASATGKKMMDNFKGSLDQLKGSVETAAITLGLALLPALRGVVDGATKAVNAALPFIQLWGPRLAAGLGAGIAAVLGFARQVGTAIGTVIDAFRKLLGGEINFAQFIGGMEIWVATIRNKLASLASQAAPYLGAFFSAIGTFIAAAAPQLAAQLQLWALSFVDWIQTTALPWLVPRLQLLLTAIGTWITGTALPAIGGWLLVVGQAFGNWVTTTAIPYLQTNLPLWLSALGTWLQGTALPAIGTFLGGIASAFGTWVSATAVPYLQANLPVWLTALSDWITGTAKPAVSGFLGGLASAMGTWVSETAIPFLQENLPKWLAAYLAWAESTGRPAVLAAMKAFGKAMGDWIVSDAIPWVQNELPKWAESVRGWILGTALPAIGAALLELGKGFGTWVTETAIPTVLANLPGWIAAIDGWILGTAIPAIITTLLKMGEAFGEWVVTKAIPFVTEKLPEWQHAVNDWIINTAMPVIKDTLLKLGEAFGDWITEKAIPWLLAKIPEWKEAIVTYLVGTALPAIQAEALKIGKALVDKFMEEAQKLKDKVFTEMALVPGKITAGIGNLSTLLFQAGVDLVQGFINGINSKIGEAIAAAGKLAGLIGGGIGDKLRIKSPSMVTMEFGRQVVEGLIVGIADGGPRVTRTVEELAGAIAHSLADTLGRLGTLTDTPSDKSAAGIMRLFAANFAVALDTMKATAGAAGDFLTEANAYKDMILMAVAAIKQAQAALNTVNFGGGGLPALSGAGENVGHSISEGIKRSLNIHSPSGVTTEFGRQVVQGMIVGMTEQEANAAKTAADVASAVAKAIQDTLGAATALGSLDVTTLPTSGQIGGILAFTRSLVAEVAASASLMASEVLTGAATWAELAGKVTAFFGTGVEAIGKLVGYVPATEADIHNFGANLRVALNDLIYLSSEIALDLVTQGATWSEQVAKGVAGYATGVDALTKLRGYASVGTGAIYAFGKDLMAAVGDLGAIVDLMGQELADKAGLFGEMVGKATGGIAGAVAGFVALRGYTRIGTDAIFALGKDLMALLGDFAAIVDVVGVELLTKAGQLGEAVGKVTGSIVGALGGMTAIRGFVRVPAADIAAFGDSLDDLLTRMIAIAGHFEQKGLDAGSALGEAIGKVFGSIGSAASGLKSLLDFVSPPTSALDAFAASVSAVIARMVVVAGTLATDGVAAAAALGEGFSKVFSGLNAGTSFFKSLDNILLPDQGGIDRILAPMLAVVRTLVAASQTLDAATLATATNLAGSLGGIFAGIESGNRALAGGGGGGGGGGGNQTNYFYFTITGEGGGNLEDRVVAAIESAQRRGRI